MLKKSRRLTAGEVRDIIKTGHPRRAGHLSARLVPGTTPLRAAAVISKKVAKSAVERNRQRRALYRALREIEASGSAVIFIQKIPKNPLTPAFLEDLKVLYKA